MGLAKLEVAGFRRARRCRRQRNHRDLRKDFVERLGGFAGGEVAHVDGRGVVAALKRAVGVEGSSFGLFNGSEEVNRVS